MADRELNTINNTGEISQIHLGGTATSDLVVKQDELDTEKARIDTNITDIATNTSAISEVDIKANQGLKTGIKSGFLGSIKTQPPTTADNVEIRLGQFDATTGNYGEGQIATRSEVDGSITLTTIILDNFLDFFIPRGSLFLVFKVFDGTYIPRAVGFVDVVSGANTYTIQFLPSEAEPDELLSSFQFAKTFGASTPPTIGYDVRRSSATDPADTLHRRIVGNQVKSAQLLGLNQADPLIIDQIVAGEFNRPSSSGIRDFDWFKVLPIQDIIAGGNDGIGGHSNGAKGHLYNLKIADSSIISWSYIGSVITINTSSPHSFETGQLVLIEGLTASSNEPNSEDYPDDLSIPLGMRNTKWTISGIPTTTSFTFTADDIPTGTAGVSSAFASKNNIGVIEIVDIAPGGTYELWWNYYDDTVDKFPSTKFTPTFLPNNRYITHKISIFPNYNEANVVLVFGQTANIKEELIEAVNDWDAPLSENSRLGYPGGSVTLGRMSIRGDEADMTNGVFRPAQSSEVRQ